MGEIIDKLFQEVMSIYGSPKELRMFLGETGLNVNESGEKGYTALHCAAMADWNEDEDGRMKILLDLGAKTEARAETQDIPYCTPLMLAASEGFTSQVRTLLEYGAKVNVQDGLGRTPLMLAISSGFETFSKTKILVAADADINIKDINGLSALDHAKKCLHLLTGMDYDSLRKATGDSEPLPDLLELKGDGLDNERHKLRDEREKLLKDNQKDLCDVIILLER